MPLIEYLRGNMLHEISMLKRKKDLKSMSSVPALIDMKKKSKVNSN